jgi:hypothetical protein
MGCHDRFDAGTQKKKLHTLVARALQQELSSRGESIGQRRLQLTGSSLKAHATGVCSWLLFIPEFPDEPKKEGTRLGPFSLHDLRTGGQLDG